MLVGRRNVMTKNRVAIPFCVMLAGFLWWALMGWLRHRSWTKHRHSGFAPGTQHLVMLATVGVLLCSTAAVLIIIFK
jgi:hypothetical protein